MSFGKLVRIHLADGSPTGIRYAEVVNWTGQGIVCPRGRVGELSGWAEETHRPGVYFLFGDDEEASKPKTYIGEAENVYERLKDHLKKKEDWNHAVLFTAKDANVTKAHVKYLEARIIQLAHETGRATLENKNVSNLPKLPRADRDAMEDFIEPIRILLGALGFRLLQPLPTKTAPVGSVTTKVGPLAALRLYLAVPGQADKAEGVAVDEGFLVFAGSQGPAEVQSHAPAFVGGLRERLKQAGDIVLDGARLRFARDVLFKSSSTAASVVCGSNRNGRASWRNAEGTTLKQLEEGAPAVAGAHANDN